MVPNKILIYAFSLFCGIILWSCNNLQPDQFNSAKVQSNRSPAFTRNAGLTLQYYFQLKDALVAEQSSKATVAAQNMNTSLINLLKDSSTLADADIRSVIDSMQSQLNKIIVVKKENYEQQRIYFAPLSNALYSFIKKAGIHHSQAYRQFCPMALNEQGAYWLTTSPKIRNPYFGKKMLTCGELTDTLP